MVAGHCQVRTVSIAERHLQRMYRYVRQTNEPGLPSIMADVCVGEKEREHVCVNQEEEREGEGGIFTHL